MHGDLRFRPATPNVTSETFDDEVVVVNFESGKYHSLQGAAVMAWTCLETGASAAEIEEALAARYDASREEIGGAVFSLLETLSTEGLTRPLEGPPRPPRIEPSTSRGPWVAPTISTFSDMQDLLFLDPIHDVDESGWPVAPPGKAERATP